MLQLLKLARQATLLGAHHLRRTSLGGHPEICFFHSFIPSFRSVKMKQLPCPCWRTSRISQVLTLKLSSAASGTLFSASQQLSPYIYETLLDFTA